MTFELGFYEEFVLIDISGRNTLCCQYIKVLETYSEIPKKDKVILEVFRFTNEMEFLNYFKCCSDRSVDVGRTTYYKQITEEQFLEVVADHMLKEI